MFGIENQQNRLITSGRKSGPRFRKIPFLVFKPVSEVPGSNPGRDKIFATWFVVDVFFKYSNYAQKKKFKRRKW